MADLPKTQVFDISHWNASDRSVQYRFDEKSTFFGFIYENRIQPDKGMIAYISVNSRMYDKFFNVGQCKLGDGIGEYQFVSPHPDVQELLLACAELEQEKAQDRLRAAAEKAVKSQQKVEDLKNGATQEPSGGNVGEKSEQHSVADKSAGNSKTSAVRASRLPGSNR